MITERLLDEFEMIAKLKADEAISQIERLYKASRAPEMPEEMPEVPEVPNGEKAR